MVVSLVVITLEEEPLTGSVARKLLGGCVM
jgi:hypothetical protein